MIGMFCCVNSDKVKDDQTDLHLPVHLVELQRLEAHALRDAQQRRGAVGVARERVARHAGVAAHEVHLDGRRIVLERQETLPHHRVALQTTLAGHSLLSRYAQCITLNSDSLHKM